jgi:hypothetical protein
MLDKRIAAKRIDSIEDLMMELEYDKAIRGEVLPWLKNLRDDIDSFIKEYEIE